MTEALSYVDVIFPIPQQKYYQLEDLLQGRVPIQKQSAARAPFCIILTQKLCTKVPLDFENDLDALIRKDLKPQLYQTPTLYQNGVNLAGLIITSTGADTILLVDQRGGLYQTSFCDC